MIDYSVNGTLTLDTKDFDKKLMDAANKLNEFNNLVQKLGKDPIINEKAMNNFKKIMGYAKDMTYTMQNAQKEANALKSSLDNLFNNTNIGNRQVTAIYKSLNAAKKLAQEEALIVKEQEYQNKLAEERNKLIEETIALERDLRYMAITEVSTTPAGFWDKWQTVDSLEQAKKSYESWTNSILINSSNVIIAQMRETESFKKTREEALKLYQAKKLLNEKALYIDTNKSNMRVTSIYDFYKSVDNDRIMKLFYDEDPIKAVQDKFSKLGKLYSEHYELIDSYLFKVRNGVTLLGDSVASQFRRSLAEILHKNIETTQELAERWDYLIEEISSDIAVLQGLSQHMPIDGLLQGTKLLNTNEIKEFKKEIYDLYNYVDSLFYYNKSLINRYDTPQFKDTRKFTELYFNYVLEEFANRLNSTDSLVRLTAADVEYLGRALGVFSTKEEPLYYIDEMDRRVKILNYSIDELTYTLMRLNGAEMPFGTFRREIESLSRGDFKISNSARGLWLSSARATSESIRSTIQEIESEATLAQKMMESFNQSISRTNVMLSDTELALLLINAQLERMKDSKNLLSTGYAGLLSSQSSFTIPTTSISSSSYNELIQLSKAIQESKLASEEFGRSLVEMKYLLLDTTVPVALLTNNIKLLKAASLENFIESFNFAKKEITEMNYAIAEMNPLFSILRFTIGESAEAFRTIEHESIKMNPLFKSIVRNVDEVTRAFGRLEYEAYRENLAFKSLVMNSRAVSNAFKLTKAELTSNANVISYLAPKYKYLVREIQKLTEERYRESVSLESTISKIKQETEARYSEITAIKELKEVKEAVSSTTYDPFAYTKSSLETFGKYMVGNNAFTSFENFVKNLGQWNIGSVFDSFTSGADKASESSKKFKESTDQAKESAKSFGESSKQSAEYSAEAWKMVGEAMVAYINRLRQIQAVTNTGSSAISKLGVAAETARRRTEGLSYSLRRLKSLLTLMSTIIVWDFVFGMMESVSSTFEAKSEMESYYDVLGWTTEQQQSFNDSLDKTVSHFARINKFQLGETLTSLGVEFDLTESELEKAANIVPMVMNEYLRAGRTTDEAVLAVKDIMQGEFTRLSRETGVGKEELESYGWSGDTTDIETLMTALEKAGTARHWDVFASKASSLNDVILITQNRFSEFATELLSVFTPGILFAFNSIISGLDGLLAAFHNMSGLDNIFVAGATLFTFAVTGGKALGLLLSKMKEWIVVREANILGINAEQAKLEGLSVTYAASKMAEEKEVIEKEAETFKRYANIVAMEKEAMVKEALIAGSMNEAEAVNIMSMGLEEYCAMNYESSFALTQESFATLENTSAKEKLAMAIETENLIQANSIDLSVAKTLGIEEEVVATFNLATAEEIRTKMALQAQLAEVKGWKITLARILSLDMETLAQGGLTTALYGKVAGLTASANAAEIDAFATASATEATEMFTGALMANPYFDAFLIGVAAITTALLLLSNATQKGRDSMSAYNEMLDKASDSSNKLAQNIKTFDDSYTSYTESLSVMADERVYQHQLEMGMVDDLKQNYHELYGAAYEGVLKLQEAKDELYAMTQTQVYITNSWIDRFKAEGYSDDDASDAGKGMGGWMDWKIRSKEDYLKTDDFMIQIETMLAMTLADVGMWLSSNFWDLVFTIKGINKYVDGLDKWLNDMLGLDNINSWMSSTSGFINKWFTDNFITPIQNFNLEQQIKTYLIEPITYWLNPSNWFKDMFVSAADGSGDGGGLTAEDWAGFFGLVDSTKQAISTKIQDLINTIKYWLNPINWFTNDGGNGIVTWWNTNIATPLNTVLNKLGIDLSIGGQQAGTNLKNGVGTGASGTAQTVQNKLNPINGVLNTARSVFGTLAKSVGSRIKSGIGSGVNGASNLVAQEMSDIKTAITNKSSEIWKAAYNTAKGIVDWIARGLERASPGASARMTLQEMNDMQMFINQSQAGLYSSAKSAGQSIVQGMHDANLSNMQSGQAVAFGLNQSTLANTTSTYNQLDGVVTNAFNGIDSTINSTGLSVQNNLTTMSDTAKTSFTDMSTDVGNLSLSNDQYLSAMSDSTLNTTIQMTSAWNTMKNKIVTAATQIRTQSYAKFNSLHKTIASFYNQLATAHFSAGLVAGYPSNGVSNHRSKSVRRYSNGSAGGSGLANIPMKHTKKIMNTVYPWKIADPWFLGIQIPMDNEVGDFKNGNTKSISYDSFEGILAKILTARGFNNPSSYEFYWNSKKSNQQVWDSVGCNCYDGAEMIIEIAEMLGLKGSLIHGSWNGLGHMGAMIGGKLYDMTQFQKHGVFRGTKGVVFGTNSGTSRHTSGSPKSNTSQQTVVKNETVVHVDLSNARIYGIDDLDEHIDKAIKKSVKSLHGRNPATGY